MRRLILGILIFLSISAVSARGPLYVVNGVVVDNIDTIEQANIATIEMLPATDKTIAEWGIEASEGVILVGEPEVVNTNFGCYILLAQRFRTE